MTTLATSHSDLDLVLRDHPAHDLGRLYGAAFHTVLADAVRPDATTLDRATTLLVRARVTQRAGDERARATDRDDEAAAAYWYGVELSLAEAGHEEPS